MSGAQNNSASRLFNRVLFAAALAALVACAAAPAAGAVGATASGKRLSYSARAKQINQVTVSYDMPSQSYVITDTGVAQIAVGRGCVRDLGDPQKASCADPGSVITSYSISVKDKNDTVAVTAAIDGKVSAGSANDTVTTAGGKQRLIGGSGDDVLDGGAGSDTLSGGSGSRDHVSYLSHPATVAITLKTVKGDDGNASDVDPVTGLKDALSKNFEGYIGSADDDHFTGTNAQDLIAGGPGNDTIDGLAGSDELDGGAGDDTLTVVDVPGGPFPGDTLRGGDDNDTLNSSIGNDVLEGGQGVDEINAGDGTDVLVGGPGADDLNGEGGNNDSINASDGEQDAFDCGSGTGDSAIVDLFDVPVPLPAPINDCESYTYL